MVNKSNLSQIIATKVYHFKEIDSTNDYASLLLSNNKPPEGTVITADLQTKGRGQFGRQWYADPGKNLLLSVILYPSLKAEAQFELNMMASLAVRETIQDYVKPPVEVKWPNDIYCENHKIAGILIQNYISGPVINTSIVGIGININQQEFCEEALNATSVSILSGKEINFSEFSVVLYHSLEKYYRHITADKMTLSDNYIRQMMGYGKMSTFMVENELIEGRIMGIDAIGRLQVRLNDEVKSFNMGEIKMVI